MKLIRLHSSKTQETIYLNTEKVLYLKTNRANGGSLIVMENSTIGVTESVEEIFEIYNSTEEIGGGQIR